MKVAGRKIKIKHIFQKSSDLLKMLVASRIFENANQVWSAYIKQTSVAGNKLKLKQGGVIHLSSNEHDILTAMVIFCRKEYGDIPKDGIVIDVGANIGAFSLYAAFNGAKRVYSFEPNLESYETLVKNITANKLENVVIPINKAVTENDGGFVLIPKSSSPYNKAIIVEYQSDEFDRVETISLPTVFSNYNINQIDLLKMDCEGGEFDIMYNMPREIWQIIEKYKLEYHDTSRKQEIIDHLAKYGFQKTLAKNMIMWFEKSNSI